jgi:hypothetical protein
LNARIALGPTSLRRLAAVVALAAGFAAWTAPAKADDTTIGGYTVTTTPPAGDGSTDSYGTGSYGTGSSTDSYGTGSSTDSYGTGSSTDSYGTGSSTDSYGTGSSTDSYGTGSSGT